MYICRVIGKEAVSASPQGLLQRTLGRAAEEARWRIKDARKGARGWKARGSRNWRVAGQTGGWLAQICARNAFRRTRGLWGSLRLWGFVKALFGGSFGAQRSLRLLRGFGAQQGSLGLKGVLLCGSPFLSPIYYNKQLRIMKNRKIIFANQKGGVGKSTLCILFANYLAWKKQDVCVIDTDLQKTIKMQRRKDMELYEGQEEPYVVQDFDVQDPETMQQLMDSASNTEGYVLFDSPGNVSEDGLVPMFTNADFIVCPYEYEEKTLDSTGTFVQVINALRQHTPEMTAKLFFVPNRIDVRIGTKNELDMWKQTDAIFKQLGAVTPRITARAALKRINTVEITAAQREAVKPAFDFMIRRMKE